MELGRERLEIICSSKPRIEFGNVRDPVTMVWVAIKSWGTFIILIDRTDPDCKISEDEKKSGEGAQI